MCLGYPLHRRSLSHVEYINNSDIITSWRPFYFDVWGKVRREKIVATVDAISGGEGIFADSDFPTLDQTFGFKFEDGLSGIDDIRVRDLIINMTDGSEGFVTERHTLGHGLALFGYSRLENGKRTDDDFGKIMEGDFIRITTPNVVSHALRISPPPTQTSEPGEEVLWMYLSRKHYEIRQEHIDQFNAELELDVELETPTLERLIYWMRREELGASDPETLAQNQMYRGAYHEALPYIRQRNRDHESTWGTPSMSNYFHSLELDGINTPSGHPYNTVDVL